MANEWMSLLQQAPTNDLDMVKTFQESQNRAISNRASAFELFKKQKADEIFSESIDPSTGRVDYDKALMLGAKNKIGLSTMQEMIKNQQDRARNELEIAQNRAMLSMYGLNHGQFEDNSQYQAPVNTVHETPYVAPTQEQSNQYNFIQPSQTNPEVSQPVQPQVQTPVANEQQVVINPESNNSVPTGGAYNLPTPELRNPELDNVKAPGYWNKVWNMRPSEAMSMIGGNGKDQLALNESGLPVLSTTNMTPDELENAKRTLARYGYPGTVDEGLMALQNSALKGVKLPTPANKLVAIKNGALDLGEWGKEQNRASEDMNRYMSDRQKALLQARTDLRQGYGDVLSQAIAKDTNERTNEQLTWDDVFTKRTESPQEKIDARNRSAAAREMYSLLKGDLPEPGTPEFAAHQLAFGKSAMILYKLPVTEDVMGKVETLVQNGTSIPSAIMSIFGKDQGLRDVVGNFVKDAANMSTPAGMKSFGKTALKYTRDAYSPLGEGPKFNQAFPSGNDIKITDKDRITGKLVEVKTPTVAEQLKDKPTKTPPKKAPKTVNNVKSNPLGLSGL